jgi:ABC-type multidrug transport system fused ATPase/permease subunit
MIANAFALLLSLTFLCAVLGRISALYTFDLRYDSLNALLHYDQKFYEKREHDPASLSYNLSTDCEKVSKIGGPALSWSIVALVSVFGGIVLAATYSPLYALVVTLCVPLELFMNAQSTKQQTTGIAVSDLKTTTAIAADTVTNIRTIHSFNLQGYFLSQYEKVVQIQNSEAQKTCFLSGIVFGSFATINLIEWGLRCGSEHIK